MEQMELFSKEELQKLDDAKVNKLISLIEHDYGPILRSKPDLNDPELNGLAVICRKAIGELLIELSSKDLSAKEYVTLDKFKPYRERLCELADIDTKYFYIWVKQILNGAPCFDYRHLIDSIRWQLDIHKSDPRPDCSTVIEDWSKDWLEDIEKTEAKKCQLELNLEDW